MAKKPENTDDTLDSLNWMARYLKIINKQGELMPLLPNIAQLKVHNTLELQRKAGLPMRGIVVKARQQGVSTLAEGELFESVNRNPNRSALVVSADTDSTALVFKMTKRFQDEMPRGMKRPTDYSNRNEIVYSSPHRSSMAVQTAGKDVLGRGGTQHAIHASEVAFWPKATEGLGGALQQVPNDPETLVVLESTGNGVGGEFFNRYVQAVDRMKVNPEDYSGYLPIFLSWHTFPDYSRQLPADYVLDLSDEEAELMAKYGLTDEQVYWRRCTIRDDCGGDLVLFKQEYPITWREAFQASGRSVFPQSILDRWEAKATPGRCGMFERLSTGEVRFYPVERTGNCWRMWWPVSAGGLYTHGTDAAEGIVSDSSNARSDPDFHGSVVLDRTERRVAAQYHGRIDPHELGEQCVLASEYYNWAWASPEMNGVGMVVLDVYKQASYPNIYQRERHEDRFSREDSPQLGWRTTSLTRSMMIEDLVKIVREQDIVVPSKDIISEMRTFVVGKDGKRQHLPGEHDDLLFGLMVAVQLHMRCPLNPQPYAYESTLDAEDGGRQEPVLARAGAYDDLSFLTEDDEDENGEFTV